MLLPALDGALLGVWLQRLLRVLRPCALLPARPGLLAMRARSKDAWLADALPPTATRHASADCDSQAGNRWPAGGQPLAAAALHPCSWPPPPMPPNRPDCAVMPRMAASAANAAAPQSRGSHAPVDSRDSGSRGPEHTHVAPHAGSSIPAAWALQQPGQAQPGMTGWPGKHGSDQLVTLCIKVGCRGSPFELCTANDTRGGMRDLHPCLQRYHTHLCATVHSLLPALAVRCSCLARPRTGCLLTCMRSCRRPWLSRPQCCRCACGMC